jgi:hypothetical protein
MSRHDNQQTDTVELPSERLRHEWRAWRDAPIPDPFDDTLIRKRIGQIIVRGAESRRRDDGNT